jgi:hypothetical protein
VRENMQGKRKSHNRMGLLDLACHAVEGKFPMIRREKNVLFVGSDGLLAYKRGVKKLRLRFWTGAQQAYRIAIVKALKNGNVPYEVGPEYDLVSKGRSLDPKPALAYLEKKAEEDIGRLARSPHVRLCLLCRELLDQAATGDLEYQNHVFAVVAGHLGVKPELEVPACHYGGCVHHEEISREMARTLIKLGKFGRPWKDARGVPVSTLSLIAAQGDAPKGWRFASQDAESRTFQNLPSEEAGTIFIRLAPKKVTLHLWIEPQYKTKHEDLESPATVQDVLETFATRVPALRDWVLKKFADLKGLAEMELDLEGGV